MHPKNAVLCMPFPRDFCCAMTKEERRGVIVNIRWKRESEPGYWKNAVSVIPRRCRLQEGKSIQLCRSKVWLRRPKNPLLALASLPADEVESLRESERLVVQFPAPPLPTCHIAPSFIFLSREDCRSSSSSKEKIARCEGSRIFPAPPRPLLNLEFDFGRPVSKREAGPRAVVPLLVLGALKVFPAPPRPLWTNLPGCGCGSVIWY
jgi:hypothetical protein